MRVLISLTASLWSLVCIGATEKTFQTHIIHAQQHQHNPSATQRKASITIMTPREDSHVPNGCRRKSIARRTELSGRPCARCAVVQVHNITMTSCSEPHQKATSCATYTTKQRQKTRLKHTSSMNTDSNAAPQ